MNLHTWARRIAGADRLVLGQVVLWIVVMISLPIVRWTAGESALNDGIIVGVLVQAGAVLAILARAWGVARALGVGLFIFVMGWCAEYMGITTGALFGSYHYTPLLQPQLLGVPVLVPVAWLMMLPPAWALGWELVHLAGAGGHAQGDGGRIAYRRNTRGLCQKALALRIYWAVASAVAFTAWDLFLDPQMVAWGFWQWESPGGLFGIPWSNYLGWLLVSSGITFLAGGVLRPAALPISPLLVVYTITWLLQSIGQAFFWDLPGPALAGFLGMGLLLGAARGRTPIHLPI